MVFMTREQLFLYLSIIEVEEDKVPVRRVAHKSHIVVKVMFLAATARPRYDAGGSCTFDGKIGIWPLVVQELAQRDSVHRPAGTPVTKTVNINRALI
jgi:hypothetical protein